MGTLAFDTLKFSQTLRGVGFDETQADGIPIAFKTAFGEAEFPSTKDIIRLDSKIDRLGTKLESLESKVETGFKQPENGKILLKLWMNEKMESPEFRTIDKIDEFRFRFIERIDSMERRITIKLGIIMVIEVIVVFALVKLPFE
uniref:DUF1640 domain-containing protein n=1 Tax=Candidatus Kentrum sp. LPFa TaxID=2126335 RepID=A0A450WTX9_9GAMM|nr:MAG: hypothetical protein BECKLPF1236A_GA0070988_102642 [Candidatus Kentron sp. LPFa]VFK34308.1 MAG: hypothetical protein BECKLPF1236C_GA0070990_102582 [Candidatus Kentron sp. LPFa]